MPFVETNGVRLYYEEQGSGPETIVFAHGLLLTGGMFEAQVSEFKSRYRCITFDFRGHGQSQIADGGYDLDTVTKDVVGLLDALKIDACHFVGVSMGGMVGMRLALAHPERVRSLTLIGTSAEAETPENLAAYRRMAWAAKWIGLWIVAGKVLPVMFGPKFLADSARRTEWKKRVQSNHRRGIVRATYGVIERSDISADIGKIGVPTLVLVGDADAATAPARSEKIHASIAGSKFTVIPGAGHLCPIEDPAAVNDALSEFLKSAKICST
jgi:pimeloyl-ACP methyl ester carboxylesterase